MDGAIGAAVTLPLRPKQTSERWSKRFEIKTVPKVTKFQIISRHFQKKKFPIFGVFPNILRKKIRYQHHTHATHSVALHQTHVLTIAVTPIILNLPLLDASKRRRVALANRARLYHFFPRNVHFFPTTTTFFQPRPLLSNNDHFFPTTTTFFQAVNRYVRYSEAVFPLGWPFRAEKLLFIGGFLSSGKVRMGLPNK